MDALEIEFILSFSNYVLGIYVCQRLCVATVTRGMIVLLKIE